MKRAFLSFALSFAVGMLGAAAAEAQLIPTGGEIVVNTILTGDQLNPQVTNQFLWSQL